MTDSQRVAQLLDGEHTGPVVPLTGFNSLDGATDRELAFCSYDDAQPIYDSNAGAVLCFPNVERIDTLTQIFVDDPRTAFAIVANEFFVDGASTDPDIHSTAVVHDEAEIGERTRIGPNAFIGAAVRIGAGCTIRAGAKIGCDGFGFGRESTGTLHRLPHRGRVRIEDDVEVGPNTTIDRAMFDETVIGQHSKLSANVHVAHQVRIGANTTVAYGAGFSGRVMVGDEVVVHPHVAVADGVSIGDGSEVGINSTVLDDVPAETTVVGSPARPRSVVMSG